MEKIIPFMWFDGRTAEAVELYTSAFAGSEVIRMSRIPEGPAKGNATASFRLAGGEFAAFDAGPQYSFSPGVSFFAHLATVEDVDRVFAALSDGGMVLMPLAAYPFSERFGWCQDRFGVSWQVSVAEEGPEIAPFLLFVGEQAGKAEEAVNFYISVFENSSLDAIQKHGEGSAEPEGAVMHASFTIEGRAFMASESFMDHQFTFTPAISFAVHCETQEEIDRLWETLSDGGQIQQCGWLQDRYGVSWQIVPRVLGEMLYESGDVERSKRVTQAMLKMVKLDIAGLERAFAGVE